MKNRLPRLKKSLGQHFLKNKNIIRKIVNAAGIDSSDTVVEIGPGGGALTEEILKRNPKILVCVEIDPEMVEFLKEKFKSHENFKILNEDAKKFDFSQAGNSLKILGNLPYNVSTVIIRNLLNHINTIHSAVFMTQKEVANRLTSTSGKDYGYLPALLQNFFKIEKLFDVPPSAFVPPPKVWSTVFKMTPLNFRMEEKELKEFENFLKRAFSNRRKKLKNNVGKPPSTELEEIFQKRAEEIPPTEMLSLFRKIWQMAPK
ncbi:16S rRNA (adenine(1518)-N(6)/adenine(1519)-N(6))-dimethyltransferase RsmA [Desulfurobacterium indicum]|uniref:16S rRNA (adenine(1518)-N(6)/adenine(1519)-N(6))- dimethyltransferase RsmA n=1 Tax=Desulfurobacterium indicum TaxID=1914305 RepID=UPI00098F0B65|nr:16S rRNA (adenine(1518)-N(6)/adenine(1519)-N(6))-dimethyltransferase RsmA [Desulfurobacterium indicum]